MRSRNICLLFFVLLAGFATSHAQKNKREPLKHEREVRDMVNFFQFMLNTLGDATTSNRDKDVLVMESYNKIFRDAKVQVEDDLDPERKVITNKDVNAYLKDVDFFFKDVKFEFIINDIEASGTSGDKLYYKVSLNRNLNGTTADGKPMRNTIPRFVEINYDTKAQDLKIVSIYTHQFNEKQALMDWWSSLSYEWQSIFKNKYNLGDSVQLSDIKKITSTDSLDLSGNPYIRSVEALAQLNDLRFLNLSNTNIRDISPLRNLTELYEVDLSNTPVSDLSPLRYATPLYRLNVSSTKIDSLKILGRLPNLKVFEARDVRVKDFSSLKEADSLVVLDLSHTAINDLSLITSLSNLSELNISHTGVSDFSGINILSKLTFLSADSTKVKDVKPLAALRQLRVLHINFTPITTIAPLQSNVVLERIYCDHTGVKQNEAAAFNIANPNTLIIYDSEDLRGWWSDLAPVWRDVFSRRAKIGLNPSKEDLAKVANLDSINISNYLTIRSLVPLSRLPKLAVIIAPKSGITDLTPLKDLTALRAIDISQTAVDQLGALSALPNLEVISADRTLVEKIDTLAGLKKLERLYVDQTGANDSAVSKFLQKNPKVLIVYKTRQLEMWWNSLSPEWQTVFQKELRVESQPTRINFHKLVELEKLTIENARVPDLSPLKEFVRLRYLELRDTDVTDFNALDDIKSLRELIARDHPIRSIDALHSLDQLQKLDITNTAVDDLEVISELKALTYLSCAGTPVKKLNPLQSLNKLEYLDCSNTDIRNLEPLYHLPLKTLRCYNSKISKGDIDKFSKFNPECNVVYYR
jgi:Leucine-rich repeat (LRR) protein